MFLFLIFTVGKMTINIPRANTQPADALITSPSQVNRPDIYYIILDGYESADAMKTYLEYDNTRFIADLESRGFEVSKDAFSNYPITILSLSSSLNMDYLDKSTKDIKEKKEWWLLSDSMKNNRVQEILRSFDYKIIEITAWETSSFGENQLHPYLIETNEFEKFFIASTGLTYLDPLLGEIVAFPSFDMHRKYVTSGLEMIKAKSKEEGPKFIYAHLISPHPPFVFDKDGNPVNPPYRYNTLDAMEYSGTRQEYRDGYVQQVQFINHNILDVVDEIIINSATPPIIILQGDHGAGLYTDLNSSEKACINERFSILLAVYSPTAPKGWMAKDITPVNIFRSIFNEYFHADYELLPNRQYFVSGGQIYNFEDVTSRIFSTCNISPQDVFTK